MSSNKTIDIKGKIVVGSVLITLLSSYPYVFDRFFPLPNLTIMIVLELFVLGIINLSLKKTTHLPKPLLLICIVQTGVFLLLGIYHDDLFYLLRFILFIFIACYSLYIIKNTVGITTFININNIWMVVQVIFGVIGFILIVLGVLQPIMEFTADYYAGVDYFYGITTSNAIIGILPRIAGYFDEPGALAQWGVYALVLNKISHNYSKKIEIILSVGLLVTFSMAFIIQLLLYYLVFNISHVKRLLIFIAVLGVTIPCVKNYIPQDSDLYFLTFRRFETSGGSLETNRDDLSYNAKNFFLEAPIMGKGYSNLVENADEFTDNPYETLATSGIVGTIALYLPLVIILVFYRKNGAWQAVTVLSLGYLQRPFHIQYIHYLMIYLLFIVCYELNKKSTKELGMKEINYGK